MTCSRRHQLISLTDAAHLPRGRTTARCSECGELILVAAPMRRRSRGVITVVALAVWALSVGALLGWAIWGAVR